MKFFVARVNLKEQGAWASRIYARSRCLRSRRSSCCRSDWHLECRMDTRAVRLRSDAQGRVETTNYSHGAAADRHRASGLREG